jgi:hypothetical protein
MEMTDADKLAKRRLEFNENATVNPGLLAITSSAMAVDGTEIPVENITDGLGVNSKKRHKTVDGTSVSADSGSAASLEGDRRTQ